MPTRLSPVCRLQKWQALATTLLYRPVDSGPSAKGCRDDEVLVCQRMHTWGGSGCSPNRGELLDYEIIQNKTH